jgi:hypothetical protein
MRIHAAKGLEFSTVFGTAVDQLPSVIKPDEARNGNLLCVEMMQAIDHLFVTWSGRSAFTSRGLRMKGRVVTPGHEPMLEVSCGGPMTSRCIRATI